MQVEYSGHTFFTRGSQLLLKTDNSHVRVDHFEAHGRGRNRHNVRQSAYATITRIFVHHMYPGGPNKVFFEGQWYTGQGTNPVARVPWVTLDEGDEAFAGCRFSPVENCEPRPIAIWPHDVFNVLPNNHPHKHYYDIIDRNDPAHRLDQRDDRSHEEEE